MGKQLTILNVSIDTLKAQQKALLSRDYSKGTRKENVLLDALSDFIGSIIDLKEEGKTECVINFVKEER